MKLDNIFLIEKIDDFLAILKEISLTQENKRSKSTYYKKDDMEYLLSFAKL